MFQGTRNYDEIDIAGGDVSTTDLSETLNNPIEILVFFPIEKRVKFVINETNGLKISKWLFKQNNHQKSNIHEPKSSHLV